MPDISDNGFINSMKLFFGLHAKASWTVESSLGEQDTEQETLGVCGGCSLKYLDLNRRYSPGRSCLG